MHPPTNASRTRSYRDHNPSGWSQTLHNLTLAGFQAERISSAICICVLYQRTEVMDWASRELRSETIGAMLTESTGNMCRCGSCSPGRPSQIWARSTRSNPSSVAGALGPPSSLREKSSRIGVFFLLLRSLRRDRCLTAQAQRTVRTHEKRRPSVFSAPPHPCDISFYPNTNRSKLE